MQMSKTTIKKKMPQKKMPSKKITKKAKFPKNVTEEPRNKEEMHLKLIKYKPSLLTSYLEVSDDRGDLLGGRKLENKVISICGKYHGIKKNEMKDPQKLLTELKDLVTFYTRQINFRESTLDGTICKYRIRQGMLFLIIKKVVKAAKLKWGDWFDQNFKGSEFRSAQDAMRLAKAKNIIRYAVLGKFRLLEILRQIEDYEKQEDPVGAYLEANGVDFKPEQETDFKDVKLKADVAINYQKLIAAGLTGITKEKVKVLVLNEKEVESKHVKDMLFLKNRSGGVQNVANYFEEIIAGGNNPPPVLTNERKAVIFKKTADKFLMVLENAITDAHYLGQIDQEYYNQIKQKVIDLERFVVAN
jgi:hypothetical protein